MDLFDLLEKFFRGIVYFIYNWVETTWTILRHPIEGPRQLLRAQNDPGVRQIGGLTYLFLLLVVFQALTVGQLASGFFQTLTNAPKLDTNAMWPEILAALIAIVAIDAVLRLVLRWRLPGRRQLRQALLSMAEFAFFWMVAPAIFLALLIELNTRWIKQAGPGFSSVFLMFLGPFLVLFIATYPAAAVLIGMRMPLCGRIQKRRRKLGLAMIGLTLLFLTAGVAGTGIGYGVQGVRNEEQNSGITLSVKTLRCVMLPDGRLTVDGLLSLPGGRAMTIEPDDLTLNTFDPDAQFVDLSEGWPIDWRESDPQRFILVESGRDQLIEVITRRPVTMQKSDGCQLNWNYARLLAGHKSETWSSLRRTEDLNTVPVRGWKAPAAGK
jgi:hypothetical protein